MGWDWRSSRNCSRECHRVRVLATLALEDEAQAQAEHAFRVGHCNPAGCQSFGAKRSYQLQQAPNPPSRRRRVRHFYEFTLYGWDRSQFRPN